MYYVGKIVRKQLASPTVMVLDLNIPKLPSFLAGQWVDFVVPPHTWTGGFSIASSPKDVPNMTLAIKKSNHPPAAWIHEESKVDQEVHVQVGGTCVLPPMTSSSPVDEFLSSPARIFCAGGIGISPILSQYREFLSQRSRFVTSKSGPGPAAKLLYSVSDEAELVFADELAALADNNKTHNPDDEIIFTLTQSPQWRDAAAERFRGVELQSGRTMKPFLDRASKDSVFYLCGPPTMLDDAVIYLTSNRGVDSGNIRCEKWW